MPSFLASKLPPPEEVAGAPRDELGLRLLRLVVHDQQGLLSRSTVANRSFWAQNLDQEFSDDFIRAMAEAWDWLVFNQLVAMDPDSGAFNGNAYVTQKGHHAANEPKALALIRAEARLDVELHELVPASVRSQFLRGEYESAAFTALRQVEIRVRELAGAAQADVGVPLMQSAFRENGPLADPQQVAAEREATMALFWGAFGVFKNPASHRRFAMRTRRSHRK